MFYYLSADGRTRGPVSETDLRALHARGELRADSQINRAGSPSWVTLSTVVVTASAGAPRASTPTRPARRPTDVEAWATMPARGLDRLVAGLRTVASPGRLRGVLDGTRTLGHGALLAAAALAVVAGLVQSTRSGSPTPVVVGLLAVIGIGIGQFVAVRFLDACRALLDATPTRLGTSAVPDVLGLVCLVAALGPLGGGFVAAIAAGEVTAAFLGLLTAADLAILGWITLQPSASNTTLAPTTAGEEAVGLLAMLLKVGLARLPFDFGLLALIGALTLLVSLFVPGTVPAELAASLPDGLGLVLGTLGTFGLGLGLVAAATVLPALAYAMFLLLYLLVDLLGAVLSRRR